MVLCSIIRPFFFLQCEPSIDSPLICILIGCTVYCIITGPASSNSSSAKMCVFIWIMIVSAKQSEKENNAKPNNRNQHYNTANDFINITRLCSAHKIAARYCCSFFRSHKENDRVRVNDHATLNVFHN